MYRIIYCFLIVFSSQCLVGQLYIDDVNNVMVGDGTATEKLEVDGNLKIQGEEYNEGFVCEKTGASASASFEKINSSAFSMGAGARGGFKLDEDFHFEFRSGPRADVLARYISTGSLLLRIEKTTGDVGIGVGNPTKALHVAGDIHATGVITSSDRKLKDNISRFDFGLNELLRIQPYTYYYNGLAGIRNRDLHVGVIAQDLQEILPQAVEEFEFIADKDGEEVFEDNYLSVNETYILYLLVNSIKEQQAQIDKLTNNDSKDSDGAINREHVTLDQNTNDKVAEATLFQNRPNPFSGETNVDFIIPDSVNKADIVVSTEKGEVINEVSITDRGVSGLTLDFGNLKTGTYYCSLICDGNLVGTNKLIFIK